MPDQDDAHQQQVQTLEAQIAELRAELGLARETAHAPETPPAIPKDPDAIVSAVIPPKVNGRPIEINGKKIVGQWTGRRSTLDQILGMLSDDAATENLVHMKRGNLLRGSELARADAFSQSMAVRPGRVL